MYSHGMRMYSVVQGRVSEQKIRWHLEKVMPYITQHISVQFGEMPVQVSGYVVQIIAWSMPNKWQIECLAICVTSFDNLKLYIT